MSYLEEKGPNKAVYYASMCLMAFGGLVMWWFTQTHDLLHLYGGFAIWLTFFCLMFMNRPRKKEY